MTHAIPARTRSDSRVAFLPGARCIRGGRSVRSGRGYQGADQLETRCGHQAGAHCALYGRYRAHLSCRGPPPPSGWGCVKESLVDAGKHFSGFEIM